MTINSNVVLLYRTMRCPEKSSKNEVIICGLRKKLTFIFNGCVFAFSRFTSSWKYITFVCACINERIKILEFMYNSEKLSVSGSQFDLFKKVCSVLIRARYGGLHVNMKSPNTDLSTTKILMYACMTWPIMLSCILWNQKVELSTFLPYGRGCSNSSLRSPRWYIS